MHHGAGRPDTDRDDVGLFGADLVDETAGKQHGNRIHKLEYGSDVGVVAVTPAKLRRQIRCQQAEHLAVQVVDGGSKKQQRADRPAVFTDSLADTLRIDGLVQIHGITLLLDYGDDLSVSSEITSYAQHAALRLASDE